MQVTEVRVYKTQKNTPLKAFVNVTLDNAFAIHGVKVIEGRNGIFVGFPNRKDKNGDFRDICHPINSEARQVIADAVLKAFNEA